MGCGKAHERRKSIELAASLGHISDFIRSVCVGLFVFFLVQVGVNVNKDAYVNSLIEKMLSLSFNFFLQQE